MSIEPEGKKGSRVIWWTRLLSRPIQYVLDLLVLVAAFYAAYLLRFEFAIPQTHLHNSFRQLPFVVTVQFLALMAAGVYAFIWRYVGMAEIKAFASAAVGGLAPMLAARWLLSDDWQVMRVPLSVTLIDTALAFGGVLGLRVLRRALYEGYERGQTASQSRDVTRRPVLLIGAGRAGLLAAREILGRGDVELEIKGFVDDDPLKRGSVIQGIRVLGGTADLPRLVEELGIDHVVITIAQAPGYEIRRIVRLCEEIPVKVRIIPALYEILQGRVAVSRIRDVQLEDLLGREAVRLEEENVAADLENRVVMVTGAGGSIGSELARQVARFRPASLLLVERAEFALFNIDRELRAAYPELSIVPLLADIGDAPRMRAIFARHRPHVVLHAAAHKHVPMMESNAVEAVKNNILGTHLLGELAGHFNVDSFVLISTDKAVRPTSIMGASKRVAELVVQDLDRRFATRYVAVRFGNVIGSAGSVIPIFREQILKGGPVTVTHPEMVRYFMTIPEAAQLVLQAGAMGEGGEIFVLDMGEPVNILDLAKDLIRLSGLRPNEDIEIVFTGVRPGEKLFEELEFDEECMTRTRHPKIMIGRIAECAGHRLAWALDQFHQYAAEGQDHDVRRLMAELLPEAQISESSEYPEAAPVAEADNRVYTPAHAS